MSIKRDENLKGRKAMFIAGAAVLLLLMISLFIFFRTKYAPGAKNAGEAISEDAVPVEVEEGLVRLAAGSDQGNMDIAKNSSNYLIALNVFDRLVECEMDEDDNSYMVPSLAREWTVSDDGKTYSFTLRDDVVFSDGTGLTAEDVEFSLTRLLTVPGSEQTDYADMIDGAEEVLEGKTDKLKGIRVIDGTHINITLKEPFPSFISMLGAPACSILSKKNVTAAGRSYGISVRYIIGSGPYIVTANNEDICIMEANPLYWGEAPSVKKAEVRVMPPAVMDREFKNGRLDLLDGDLLNIGSADAYLKDERYRDSITLKDCVGIVSLTMNEAMPPLDDVRVRRAIQYAIDRDRILNECWGGCAELTDGIYPKGLIGYNEELQGWLKHDPERAKELLREAGVGKKDTVELIVSSKDGIRNQLLVSLVQEDLAGVGLNAVIVTYDEGCRSYLRERGQIMAGQSSWTADYNDPENFIYPFFGPGDSARKRLSNYGDTYVMSRIEKARHIVDTEERLAEYRALEKKLVVDEAVWVPCYSSKHIFVRGDRVASFTPYWAGWSAVPLKGLELR